MAKKQTDFIFDILWKIKAYQDGLEAVQQLVANKAFDKAVVKSLETLIFSCTGEIPFTNSMHELFNHCTILVPDINIFISPHLPHQILANRLEGILRERKAYYTQLQNLHTPV